ncbi:hypothetical protein BH23GEM6_BH23GEM6_09030 [soil metagenome]
MKYRKLFVCALPLLLMVGCSDDDGITPGRAVPPAATVRFVNATVDTGTVDLSFVDIVENLPTLKGIAFQSHSGGYQRVQPGTRAARVFPNSSDLNLTQVRLVDTNLNLAANTRYTLVYAGRARSGAPANEAHRLHVIEDPATPPTPPAGQIALQALNAAVGVGNVDVYIVPVASATADTPADFATNNAGRLNNVAFLGKANAYVNVPALTGTMLYRFVVTAAGSQTPLFATTVNQPGVAAPAGASHGPQPGVRIAGSVMTAVVLPGSTPGSRQSTATNQNQTVALLIDRVLNP